MQNEADNSPVDLAPTEPYAQFVEAPAAEPPQAEAPVQAEPPGPKAQELTGSVIQSTPSNAHDYPSLYDTKATSVLAIIMGIFIVAGVQIGVARIFAMSKTEHHALTHFVTAMVGLVLGVYVCDMLIAGPTTELLAEQERITILAFIKDTCLMVFAYYFGTRAIPPDDNIGTDKSDPKAGGTGG